jgi:hypothetical protein
MIRNHVSLRMMRSSCMVTIGHVTHHAYKVEDRRRRGMSHGVGLSSIMSTKVSIKSQVDHQSIDTY